MRQHRAENSSKASEIIRQALVVEGHSHTRARRQILQAFVDNDKPLTPAAAHKRLADGKINLASVYRAIDLFCRVGVLTEVDHISEGRRYELSDQYRGHHHHLICDRCGKTEDFEDCELEGLEKLIRRRFHFEITRHDLRFIGLCQHCRR